MERADKEPQHLAHLGPDGVLDICPPFVPPPQFRESGVVLRYQGENIVLDCVTHTDLRNQLISSVEVHQIPRRFAAVGTDGVLEGLTPESLDGDVRKSTGVR
jgi:hypothetical protein